MINHNKDIHYDSYCITLPAQKYLSNFNYNLPKSNAFKYMKTNTKKSHLSKKGKVIVNYENVIFDYYVKTCILNSESGASLLPYIGM